METDSTLGSARFLLIAMSERTTDVGDAVSSLDTALRSIGRRFVERHPELESDFRALRDGYVRAYLRCRWLANRVRFDAPPRPFRLIGVDPARVTHVDRISDPLYWHAATVAGGEWDRETFLFEGTDVYRAYERHFEDGVPWRETAFYERIVSQLDAGRTRWGCRTRAEFDERCACLDRLYETIRTEGYRTQAQLRAADVDDPVRDPHALKTERFGDEVTVNIGRNGEVLFTEGRNRLAIVKILGLDRIPVRVLRRHREWQAVRDRYVRGEPIPEEHRGHPDLTELDRCGGD